MGPRFSGKVREEPQRREGGGENYETKTFAIRRKRGQMCICTFRITVHAVPGLGLDRLPLISRSSRKGLTAPKSFVTLAQSCAVHCAWSTEAVRAGQ